MWNYIYFNRKKEKSGLLMFHLSANENILKMTSTLLHRSYRGSENRAISAYDPQHFTAHPTVTQLLLSDLSIPISNVQSGDKALKDRELHKC